jgi:sugar phosphate permease
MRYRVAFIILAGFFTIFAAFGIRYSYGMLLPEMLASLGISKTEAGVVYSSYFLVYTLSSPLLGLLVDRSNAKTLLTVFVSLLGLGACLMSTASSVFQASIFFALAGLGHSACWAPVVTVVMRWISQRQRGLVLSLVDLGSAGSIAFWGVTTPLIVRSHSWRTVWLLLGAVAFFAAILNFLCIKDRPPLAIPNSDVKEKPKSRTSIRHAYRSIFRAGKFYLIGVSYLLISFSILIPFTFLTAYGTQELHISYSSAAGLVAVIGIAGTVGKLILGYISDRIGRLWVMMLCGLLTAVGGLGMAMAQEYSLMFMATIVFGVGYGTIWPQYAAFARDQFPEEHAGSVIGLWTLFHGLGSVLAPVIAGWTIDVTGVFFWAFILTVVSGFFSLLLLVPLLPKRCPQRSD